MNSFDGASPAVRERGIVILSSFEGRIRAMLDALNRHHGVDALQVERSVWTRSADALAGIEVSRKNIPCLFFLQDERFG